MVYFFYIVAVNGVIIALSPQTDPFLITGK